MVGLGCVAGSAFAVAVPIPSADAVTAPAIATALISFFAFIDILLRRYGVTVLLIEIIPEPMDLASSPVRPDN